MGSAFIVRFPGFHPAVFCVGGRGVDGGGGGEGQVRSGGVRDGSTDTHTEVESTHARTGADFPVLVGEIYGLHEPDRLVDVPPDRQVVDRHLFDIRKSGFLG